VSTGPAAGHAPSSHSADGRLLLPLMAVRELPPLRGIIVVCACVHNARTSPASALCPCLASAQLPLREEDAVHTHDPVRRARQQPLDSIDGLRARYRWSAGNPPPDSHSKQPTAAALGPPLSQPWQDCHINAPMITNDRDSPTFPVMLAAERKLRLLRIQSGRWYASPHAEQRHTHTACRHGNSASRGML
jgi:hypothetical protein